MNKPEVPEDGVREDLSETHGRPCLTIGEVAAATTFSLSTIERLIRRGVISPVQLGGKGHRRIFPAEAIERLLRHREAAQRSTPTVSTKTLRGPRPKWNKSRR